MEENRTS